MKSRATIAMLVVFLVVFSTVASGCIGGESETTTGTQQTTSPGETSSQPAQTGVLEMGKVYVVTTDKSVVVVGPKGAEPTVDLP